MKLSQAVLNKVNKFYNVCIVKYLYHLNAATKYKQLYIYTTTPIIIFSSITTVLASYNGNTIDPSLAVAVAIFSGLTTIGQALVSFVEFNVKYTTHFAVSAKFMNLARLIESEITINYLNTQDETNDEEKTAIYVKYLFDMINAQFKVIQDAEPYLPMVISTTTYTQLLKNSNKDVGILMPELMIEPVVETDVTTPLVDNIV